MSNDRDIPNNTELESQRNEFEKAGLLFEKHNYAEALSLYLRLADSQAGNRIYLRIGWMYEFGMGTKKDTKQAERWYQRAADAGISAGYYSLASMRFREGKQDEVRKLMQEAAAAGYAPASFHLGQMYRFGKGVPVDQIKAVQYYQQAAAAGHLFAQRAVAEKYLKGEYGVWRIPKGFLMLTKIIWTGFILAMKDPSSDRIRRLA